MIFGSRKVYELYQRYSEQALEILHRSSCDLTVEERRQIWDEVWEEEKQSWILALVKRKIKERKSKDKSLGL